MPLIKYSAQQQIEILEKKMNKLLQQDVKGWYLVVKRYYQIKELKQQLKELRKK